MTPGSRRLVALAFAGASVFAIAALPFAPLPAVAVEGPQPMPVGEQAPDFETVDIDGKPFALKEALAQGPVMLVFWSIFCGSCLEEMPILQQEMPKFEESKVRLVAVNLDEAKRLPNVKKFAIQKGLTFSIVVNKNEQKNYEVDILFGVKMTPALFLLDKAGKVIFSHYGPLAPEDLEPVLAKLKG